MTLLSKAKYGEEDAVFGRVASKENIQIKRLMKGVSDGSIVIPKNPSHKKLDPIGIGQGLRTKVNANIGTSAAMFDISSELEKLRAAIDAGTDTVMDLSTGGDIDKVRQEVIAISQVPVGTVPLYQAITKKDVAELESSDMIKAIRRHVEDGVDFITVHSGITRSSAKLARKRVMGIVSRGGAYLAKWMEHHKRENPLYEEYDKVLFHAKRHDATISLGDGLRPGAIKDATDKAQLHELKILGELQKRSFQEDVQSMIEGPGHVPIDQIRMNIDLQKKQCSNAPFYVLGPLVTDIAPGYDHITSAIGGAIIASMGADFLCYVTPTEHLGLPDAKAVHEGVIATRIAAHAGDIAKGIPGAKEWDLAMSQARLDLDWEGMFRHAIDPKAAREIRDRCSPNGSDTCSMCDRFCSAKVSKELKGN